MRALLDINVLIALLDPDHVFHERAHGWWERQSVKGWASCPLTENGLVRIMSHPNYSKNLRLTPATIIGTLATFAAQTNHVFWGDELSLRDTAVFDAGKITLSQQITDLYLLALAMRHEGTLATFDRDIPLSPVPGAGSVHLTVL